MTKYVITIELDTEKDRETLVHHVVTGMLKVANGRVKVEVAEEETYRERERAKKRDYGMFGER